MRHTNISNKNKIIYNFFFYKNYNFFKKHKMNHYIKI